MNRMKYIRSFVAVFLGCAMALLQSCERSLSDDFQPATLSETGEIFIDNFVGLGTNFYFPFVGDGAKPDVLSVDEQEAFESFASIRIDVPNADDPSGNFAGASLVIDGAGRNLSGFDALTFYAMASQSANIGSLAFGSEFRTAVSNVTFTPRWTKFIIPIPDPSKLTDVKTVFEFSAGGIGAEGQEVGYTFWIDNLQFENLGTVAQPRPSILNGEEVALETFVGARPTITDLAQTFNLATGINQTVSITPAYLTFSSSDETVATVDESGEVLVTGAGTAEISAVLAGVRAEGSLMINSEGELVLAEEPTLDASEVLSVFSDSYENVPTDGFNGNFGGQTTQGGDLNLGENNIILYTDLNFVGIPMIGTIDASAFTHLHLDVQVRESVDAGDVLTVELIDFGPDGVFGGGDDTGGGSNVPDTSLSSFEWVGIDIPLTGFTQGTGGGFAGSPNVTNIAQVVFVSGNISSIMVDNIYFYSEN